MSARVCECVYVYVRVHMHMGLCISHHIVSPNLHCIGRNYNESCDVFSFGVVFWEMITRRRPTLGAGKGQHSNMAILYAMANGESGEK